MVETARFLLTFTCPIIFPFFEHIEKNHFAITLGACGSPT